MRIKCANIIAQQQQKTRSFAQVTFSLLGNYPVDISCHTQD